MIKKNLAISDRAYLDTIKPILKYTESKAHNKNLIEFQITAPEEIHLIYLSGKNKFIKDKDFSIEKIKEIADITANMKKSTKSLINDPKIFKGELPVLGYRTTIILGKIITTECLIAIRLVKIKDTNPEKLLPKKDIKMVKEAIIRGDNIVIGGGTGSGKTTLLNALIKWIDPALSITTIQDALEIIIPNENKKRRIIELKTFNDPKIEKEIINAVNRINPDIVLMGELKIGSVMDYLRIANLGNSSCLTTLHSNNAIGTILALIQNAQFEGIKGDPANIYNFIVNSVQMIIHIKRKGDKQTFEIIKNLKTELPYNKISIAT